MILVRSTCSLLKPYGDEPAAPAAPPPEALPYDHAPAIGPVEGSVAVDFSKLGQPKEPAAAPAEAPEKGEAPPGAEKPLQQPPAKPASPPKEAAQPPKPTPEAKKEPAKAPEPAKAAEKPAEKTPEAARPEKKPDELPTIEQIDAMVPKKGAPEQVVAHFQGLKTATKAWAERARDLEAEVAALKAAPPQTAVPPEVEKELETLRSERKIFLDDRSPEVLESLDKPLKEADENLFSLLNSQGLDGEGETAIRNALTHYDAAKGKWLAEVVEKIQDPFAKDSIRAAINARLTAARERDKNLAARSTDRETYVAKHREAEQAQVKGWIGKATETAKELAPKYDWAMPKAIPEGATAAVRASVEKYNTELAKKTEVFQQQIALAYAKDPATITTALFKAFHADHQATLLEQQEADLTALRARVEELETLLGEGTRRAMPTVEGSTDVKPEPAGVGGDSRDAFDKFQWGKRR